MAKFIDPFANNNVLTTVADLHKAVGKLVDNKKADTEAINGMVIEQYAQLIPCAIAVGVRVTTKDKISKGKLVGGADVIDNFKDGLTTYAGYSESVMKKRYENTIKAVVSFGWDKNSTNLTADGVKAAFTEAGITSEAKLAAHVKQAKPVDDMEALAQKLFGKRNAEGTFNPSKYNAEEWADFDNHYAAYKAARIAADKEAAEKLAEKNAENELVDSVVDQF
tara:strand:- start:2014 stop:2679 length:666 start_codon:yes stop_codon:yes gene_type:complete